MNETKIINRLSTVGIAGNIALVVFKLYAGIAGHSGAMVSDAVHSLSDVFASRKKRRIRITPTGTTGSNASRR